jgi:hypothetical protein
MPSLLTHQFFATQCIEFFKEKFPYLLDHYSVVTLGAQGPDPLFFYGHAPFSKRHHTEDVNQLGSLLHAEPQRLIDLISTIDKDLTSIELSYLFGALTHYILDRTVHPYVFFHTGFNHDGQLVPPFQGAHAKFEVALDVAVKQHYRLESSLYHPSVTLGISDEVFAIIDAFYVKAYPAKFQKGIIEASIKDMQRTYAFLYHASKLKKGFVRLLTGKKSLPFNLIHPKKLTHTLVESLLNNNKLPYQHPVTAEVFYHSFEDLFNLAFEDMKQLMTIIFSEQTIDEKKEKVIALIQTIDYDGKKVGSTMKFFKPFFKGF